MGDVARRERSLGSLFGLLSVATIATACAGPSSVQRVYAGDAVDGRFIGPEAYASFLSGAIAEGSGDLRGALASYEKALRRDGNSPELWTRVADVRCHLDAHDPKADEAFKTALEDDPGYARAWTAKARCLTARGDAAGAREAASKAARLDPGADAANVFLAGTGTSDARMRERLVALTMTAGQPEVAWDALATWARGHGDIALWSRALRELVRVSPSRREDGARASEDLAGMGAIAEARAVAAAALDAQEAPMGGADRRLARRLAVDHAIANGNMEAVRRMASRARLPVDEAAGRAWLAGKRETARALAEVEAGGDPTARGARWVLAVCTEGDLAAAAQARKGEVEPSGAAIVAFGAALAERRPVEEARALLRGVLAGAIVAGDDLVVRAAVELASRGVLEAGALPPDGGVELAVLRGEKLPARSSRLDDRHEYLALSYSGAQPQRARALGERLARVTAGDPVVLAARALEQLASGSAVPRNAPGELLAANPADPLLAAVALRLAEKVGDPEVARRARATLTAVLGRGDASVQ